ncbi:MAG: hypothetical protein IJM90_01175 [Firmicutes bacterium]|nr:hypothetical protein [Bacillota bacterium]
MAQKIVRANGEKTEAKKTTKAAATKKAAEEAKKEVEEVAETEAKKPQIKDAKPTGGSSIGYRIGAVVLWILAIACEVLAIMVLLNAMYVGNKALWLIIFIVADLVFAIIAAQLWKKANRIKPMSKKNKFLFYLWSELGVIMAAICFIPLIILLLKDKDLDKKTKTLVTIVACAALLITGAASADYDPISAEEKAAAEQEITSDVYWTTFGRKYHIDQDCQAITNSSTLYQGTVTEAIENGRASLCAFCAAKHPEIAADVKTENAD